MYSYISTCVICWLYTLVYYLLGGRVQSNYYPLFSLTLMWIPGIIALWLSRAQGIRLPVFTKPNRYFFYAALMPIAIGILTTLLSMPFGIEKSLEGMQKTLFSLDPLDYQMPSPTTFVGFFLLFVSALVAGTFYIFAALGEELFWRGYLWEKLKYMGFWKASLLIGLGWGIWHWPIITMGHNYPGFPLVGNLMMIAFAILASPLMTYYRVMARSVMGAAIFHGFMNIAAAAAFVIFVRPNELYLDVEGVAGLVALIVMNLWFFTRSGVAKRLRIESA